MGDERMVMRASTTVRRSFRYIVDYRSAAKISFKVPKKSPLLKGKTFHHKGAGYETDDQGVTLDIVNVAEKISAKLLTKVDARSLESDFSDVESSLSWRSRLNVDESLLCNSSKENNIPAGLLSSPKIKATASAANNSNFEVHRILSNNLNLKNDFCSSHSNPEALQSPSTVKSSKSDSSLSGNTSDSLFPIPDSFYESLSSDPSVSDNMKTKRRSMSGGNSEEVENPGELSQSTPSQRNKRSSSKSKKKHSSKKKRNSESSVSSNEGSQHDIHKRRAERSSSESKESGSGRKKRNSESSVSSNEGSQRDISDRSTHSVSSSDESVDKSIASSSSSQNSDQEDRVESDSGTDIGSRRHRFPQSQISPSKRSHKALDDTQNSSADRKKRRRHRSSGLEASESSTDEDSQSHTNEAVDASIVTLDGDMDDNELWLIKLPADLPLSSLPKHVKFDQVQSFSRDEKNYDMVAYKDDSLQKEYISLVRGSSDKLSEGPLLQGQIHIVPKPEAEVNSGTPFIHRKLVPLPTGLKARFTPFGADGPSMKRTRQTSTEESLVKSKRKSSRANPQPESSSVLDVQKALDVTDHPSDGKSKKKKKKHKKKEQDDDTIASEKRKSSASDEVTLTSDILEEVPSKKKKKKKHKHKSD